MTEALQPDITGMRKLDQVLASLSPAAKDELLRPLMRYRPGTLSLANVIKGDLPPLMVIDVSPPNQLTTEQQRALQRLTRRVAEVLLLTDDQQIAAVAPVLLRELLHFIETAVVSD